MVGELCLFKNPDIEQLNMKEVILLCSVFRNLEDGFSEISYPFPFGILSYAKFITSVLQVDS